MEIDARELESILLRARHYVSCAEIDAESEHDETGDACAYERQQEAAKLLVDMRRLIKRTTEARYELRRIKHQSPG